MRLIKRKTTFVAAAVLILVLATAGTALAQDPEIEGPGNFCVKDYRPGAVCTANDVQLEAVFIVGTPSDPCEVGVPNDTATLAIQGFGVSTAAERYDIGIFLATDGTSHEDGLGALGGDSCIHTYLDPDQGLTTTPTYELDMLPLDAPDGIPDTIETGPWFDGDSDTCGDLEQQTGFIQSLSTVTIACVDSNGDGEVDISGCVSWENNQDGACNSLQEAIPSTNSKCGCTTLEVGFTPTGISLSNATASGGSQTLYTALAAVGLLALATLFVIRRRGGALTAA